MDELLKEARKFLEGKTIKSVRYMTNNEMDEMGWYEPSLVIVLDDDSDVIVMSDWEGNQAGRLSFSTNGIA